MEDRSKLWRYNRSDISGDKENALLFKGSILPKLPQAKTHQMTTHFPRNGTKYPVSPEPGSHDVFRHHMDISPRKRSTVVLSPLTDSRKEVNDVLSVDEGHFAFSRPLSTDDGFSGWDGNDFQYTERAGIFGLDREAIEDIDKEVSRRVIAGMVLTTKCGKKIEDISQSHLTKRVGTFLGRPLPVSVTSARSSARFPRLLTPLALTRERQGGLGCLGQHKVSKIYGESLKNIYLGSRETKCRYIRAPLSPIPSVEWVFDGCGRYEEINSFSPTTQQSLQ